MDRINFPHNLPQPVGHERIKKDAQKDTARKNIDPDAFAKVISRYQSDLPELEGAIDQNRSDLADHARMKLQHSAFLIKHLLGL